MTLDEAFAVIFIYDLPGFRTLAQHDAIKEAHILIAERAKEVVQRYDTESKAEESVHTFIFEG